MNEEMFICRLRTIVDSMQKHYDTCREFETVNNTNIDRARVAVNQLQSVLKRFSSELIEYFKMEVDLPSAEITTFSEQQLRSEELLIEIETKIQIFKEGESNKGNNQITSKLPKLNLAEFSGDILEFCQFWDQFNSNVNSRALNNVDKFLYLKASLKGDAKLAIEGLEVTNNNYPVAVDILKNRFGKQQLIIDAHYTALYKIKTATNVREARHTLNEMERHLRVLTALGEDTDHNHLRCVVMQRMPSDIIYELKLRTDTNTIGEIRNQLEKIITAKEDANRITQDNLKEEYTTQTLHINGQERRLGGNNRRDQYKSIRPTLNFKANRFEESYINKKLQNNKEGYRRHQVNHKNYKRELPFQNKSREYQHKSKNQREIRKRRYENLDQGQSSGQKRKKHPCIFCQGGHYNDQCDKYKTKKERENQIKMKCFICFGESHQMKSCKAKYKCFNCGETGKHNRALCPNLFKNKNEETNTLHAYAGSSTILQTAVAVAHRPDDSSGQTRCRILLDSGSQKSYITLDLVNKLKLTIEEESELSVFTFGTKSPQVLNSPLVKLQIKTRTNAVLTIFANAVPCISNGVPYQEVNLHNYRRNRIMADDGSLSSRVDILIGNEYYFAIIMKEKIQISDQLYLVESKLGWILSGRSDNNNVDNLSALTYFQSAENKLTDPDIPLDNKSMKCLWDLESIGICDSPKASRDEETIKQFNDTIELIDERYTVSWPWKEYPPDLPLNLGLATGRLVNLLKRLSVEDLTSYNNTLKEQLSKGIIEIIPEDQIETNLIRHPIHYLPHHGIRQPDKPIRIVYDASASTKTQKSLNECLYCGPLMLEDLTGMFLRFRCHQIGIIADVEKAFLQLALHERDKDVTRFLWMKDIDKPANKENLLHLRFCRVPFGVISSPFLLNATLKYHLSHYDSETVKEIVNDIYVDNLVTGAESTKEAIEIYHQGKAAFQDISMNLREWSSNSQTFLNNIQERDVCKDKVVKVLGLTWDTENDTIRIKTKKISQAYTKRDVLKNIASIYDPCGYAVPDLLPAKLFLQKLWIEKWKWDTKLTTELSDEWQYIENQLLDIQDIVLSRRYFSNKNIEEIQLHVFTDSSTKAYAAAAYLSDGREVSFILGKSRLVPIKDQENLKIPRLELLGVLIGSRLIKYISKFIQFTITKQTIWTDSQIVIDWYNSNKLLPPFVARRIQEIKENKSLQIRYVPTELNPADVATRTMKTKEEKEIWLSGPKFLKDDPKTWPTSRRGHISLHVGEGLPKKEDGQLQRPRIRKISREKYNSANVNNEPQKEIQDIISKPTIQEIKKIQSKYFPEETDNRETNLSRNLGLFKDVDGILRCKGRLKNAEWTYDKRYPILIPKNCDFTTELIQSTHEKNYHVGVNHTLSLIRLTYWIPQGRSQVQKTLKKCPNCVKHGGGPYKLPPTPALPKERANYSSPYTFTGLDYLGPVLIKTDRTTEKRWICLYTCLAVRAVHLEVVKDLTAEECLLALRRFVASRGKPSMMISDNATQFKLTAEVLSSDYCIKSDIKWKFIPQLAPWHGGFYERLVGIVKHCLKRTLTKTILNEGQLNTVVKEIESVINSRPLTCVNSDMEEILKPSDFLTMGKCIVMTPSENTTEVVGTITKQDLIAGWRRCQNMLKDFKKMFTDQYLPSLRERYQHSHKEPRVINVKEPKIGDIVQIKGDNKNREEWKVGKITALIKGIDGHCRVAKVVAGKTEYTRSISHLYPLEVDESYEDNTASRTSNTTIAYPSQKYYDHSSPNDNPLKPDEHSSVIPFERSKPIDHQEITAQKISDEDQTAGAESENVNRESVLEEETHTAEESIKPMRVASLRAREKLREWTQDLLQSI